MTSGGIRRLGNTKNNKCAKCGIVKTDDAFGYYLAKRKIIPDQRILQRWCKSCRVIANSNPPK